MIYVRVISPYLRWSDHIKLRIKPRHNDGVHLM